MTIILIAIIFLAIAFDFINGFHDAANSIATIVSTKVLSPFQAVVWAAFFNFVAFFVFSDHAIANTVAKTVHQDSITLVVILAGVVAAIIWNLLTWWYGIPSSSSHTLIGGFAGAGVAHAGLNAIDPSSIMKTVAFIFLAPLIGMIISMFITLVTIQTNFWKKILIITGVVVSCVVFIPFKKAFEQYMLAGLGLIFIATYFFHHQQGETASNTANMFKRLQLVSSAAFSVGHGGSDAQKVMGIIAAALVAGGQIPTLQDMPNWVPLACYLAIAAGTMSGGWKIVKTMGTKITKVTPLEGVCAETAGAITLFTAANLGAPVSTTHTITGSIIGVGAVKRVSAVRWGVTTSLMIAWVLTIPVSAFMAGILYFLFSRVFQLG